MVQRVTDSIVRIDKGQIWLDERKARTGLQAFGAVRRLAGLGERDAHGIEQSEQQERRDDRHQRQDRARLAAEQCGPDQMKIFHG